MLILVTYDVVNDRRRARVAKVVEDFGRRVQYSVFECDVKDEERRLMVERLEKTLDEEEDSIRIYDLCAGCRKRIEILGQGTVTEDPPVYIL